MSENEEVKIPTRTSWTVNGNVLIANFPDGESLTFDVDEIKDEEVRNMSLFYGIKQKCADAGAGAEGWPAKREKMSNCFEMLKSGKWTDKKFRRTNEEVIADKIGNALSSDAMSDKEAETLKKLLAKAGMKVA